MNNMTAEEVFKNNFTLGDAAMPKHIPKYIYESMIEFAQYHVKEALKAASEKAELEFTPYDQESWTDKSIEREDILSFYGEEENDLDFQYEEVRNRAGFSIEANKESILKAYPKDNIK